MSTEFEYQPSPQMLKGRVIVITGAGGGLGSALSIACAKLGATVVLSGRSVKKLEAVYDQIEAEGGVQPAILPMNLMTATWGEYEAFAASLEQNLGRLDGLVHAAAHFKSFARMEDLEPREWLDSLQVNLTAAYTLTRQCLPLLRQSPDASVIQIQDGDRDMIRPFRGIYGIAKNAAAELNLALAAELTPDQNLRFNVVDPGPMRTALRMQGFSGESPVSAPLPESRLARLLWLLGPDSAGVSGNTYARP